MKEALYYRKLDDGDLQCNLCPHNCIIKEDRTGLCGVRRNTKGKLMSLNYGILSSIHIDPIEKKPLYHFYPGKNILSLGSFGCNLKCSFCQNWEISQYEYIESYPHRAYSIENIIEEACKLQDNIGIAYTYNEPTVWYEYMKEVAQNVREKGLKNVVVSNGFINHEPLKDILPLIDAFNIDIKAFTNSFYKKITKGELQPVLDVIKQICKSGKHIELTNLVIPKLNDSEDEFREMVKWIEGETGKDTVLHISKYFPNFRMRIEPTPTDVLDRFYEIASEYLNYVYLGNVYFEPDKYRTFCANCKSAVIERTGFSTDLSGIDDKGNCKHCGHKVVIQ